MEKRCNLIAFLFAGVFFLTGLWAVFPFIEKLALISSPGFLGAALINLLFSLVMFAVSVFVFLKSQWIVRNSREVLLVVASVVICLVALEIGLRLFYIFTYKGTMEDVHGHFPNPPKGVHVLLGAMIRPHINQRIIYILRPDLDIFYQGVRATTNSSGWREGEHPKKKLEHTIRVVGIGDSVMFGWGVEENRRYMDVLERKLNENFPEHNWEVLVFAVPGYNLVMEVEILKQEALGYNPDLIVYGFIKNDFCLPGFLLRKRSFCSSRPMVLDYLDPYIQNNIFFQGKTLLGKPFGEICEEGDIPEPYKGLAGEEAFVNAFKELADIGVQKNIPVVVFSEEKLEPFYQAIHENIYYFDAGKEMEYYSRFYKQSDFIINKNDRHPSETGHRIMAEAIYRQLLEADIIQDIVIKKRLESATSR